MRRACVTQISCLDGAASSRPRDAATFRPRKLRAAGSSLSRLEALLPARDDLCPGTVACDRSGTRTGSANYINDPESPRRSHQGETVQPPEATARLPAGGGVSSKAGSAPGSTSVSPFRTRESFQRRGMSRVRIRQIGVDIKDRRVTDHYDLLTRLQQGAQCRGQRGFQQGLALGQSGCARRRMARHGQLSLFRIVGIERRIPIRVQDYDPDL